MQILILGMHRSGTSATARLVNMMGAYFAPEGMALPPKPDNPKGFWERRDVLQLNDELLKLQGCEWNKLAKWRFEEAGRVPDKLRRLIHILVMNMDGYRPWFLKDPRLCLTLPAWLPFLEVPVAIMVYRNPQEIAISLKNRSPQPREYSLALWEYYTVGMLNATRQMPRIFIKHDDLLSRPVKSCESLLKQLTEIGVRRLTMPTPHEIRSFIDPKLYRAKPVTTETMVSLSDHQQQLSEILQGNIHQKEAVQVSAQSHAIIQQEA